MPICANCGQENPGGARFCLACGARLDLQRMAEEERKIVTVLFADVTRSTELGDRLDAEQFREVMSAWYQAMRSEIEAQGGTVEKYIGDAVMAVFGVPVAHEDDPARALRAALAMRDRLVVLNRELAKSHGVGIEIRTGVNTGEAMATLEPPTGEAMVTGVAVNAAARLEQLAEPGQTLVAERTARSASGFRFEDLGLLHLRGKQEPVRALALVGAAPHEATRGLPGVEAPLVGRERELDLLTSLQERVVVERRPHLVTIYGDPGVGKSRLIQELVQRLSVTADAPRIVTGRCPSYGEGITYWPLAEILKGLADVADDDPVELVMERIRDVVTAALGGPPTSHGLIVAALAFTLGLDSGDPEFARLQPSAVRVELHRAWRALLSALAEERPLVAVVDDIHWADRALLDLLEEVAERVQGPLFLVCPARPELTDRHPGWGGGRRSFSGLFLAPLTPEAAQRLAGHLLDVEGLPEATRAQILERAEGNPFFLEEILRHLIDEGGVVRDGDRWQATDELVRVELPDTVQAVLAARIDLLEPREKRTLQQASVVGRVFWSGAVAVLLGDQDGLDPALRRLEERELVVALPISSLVGEEELSFRHILTRDVAYETLPRRERPFAHARAAAWVAERAGDRRAEFVGLLAHHYAEAYRGARLDRAFEADELEVLRSRAFGSLIEGSQVALRGAGYARARALAETALDFAIGPAEQATALEALGHGYSHDAMGDGAWRCYRQAVDLLVESACEDSERIARLCGRAVETVCRWTGTLQTVPPESAWLPYLKRGLEEAASRDGEGRVRLLIAETFWGRTYPNTSSEFRDPRRAREAGEEAAAVADRIGRLDLVVVALDGVQDTFQQELLYRESHATSFRRLELARGAGDVGELGDSYAVAAWNAVYLGKFLEARLTAQEGYDLLRTDSPLSAVHALSWGAVAAFYLGDWDGLLADLESVRAGFGERADTPIAGFASPWPAAAFVHEARGDRSASERLLDQVYAIERNRGALSAYLSPLIVRTLVLRGDLTGARRRLDELVDRDRGLPLLLFAEGELLLGEERWNDAPGFAELLRLRETHSGTRMLVPLADRLAGRTALAAYDLSEALPLLESAANGFAALEMAVDAAVARLDVAEALFELGRPEDARRFATDAGEVLERVGYLQALARANAMLDHPPGSPPPR